MTLKFSILIIGMVFYCTTFAQPIARVENVHISSKALNQEREILIYTPVDYDWRTNEYFNVIYVFDSQNREFFDYTSSIINFLADDNASFIVVGITSPYHEALDYSRNNDLLPLLETENAKKRYGKYHGNADNFLKYVSDEVVTYVKSNYRTLEHSTAIGHSLSASFILYTLTQQPNLFSNYIAISPNFACEDEALAHQLIGFDYTQIQQLNYLFISHADEGTDYWQEWKPAREKVYRFFNEQLPPSNIAVQIAAYPTSTHWNTFPLSLKDALEDYLKNMQGRQASQLSAELREVTIRLTVPHEQDIVYITGNQINLGNWDPGKIQMKKTSAFEREISLYLQSPAQFRFTKGNWDTALQVVGTYKNLTINLVSEKEYTFEVVPDTAGEE